MQQETSHARGCFAVVLVLVCSLAVRGQVPAPRANPVPRADTKDSDSREPGESHLDTRPYPLTHFLDVHRPDFAGPAASAALCLGCPKENGKATALADYDVVTEKRRVGTYAGHALLEAHLTFSLKAGSVRRSSEQGTAGAAGPAAAPLEWKLILAEVGRGLYQQIYGISSSGDYLMPLSWSEVFFLEGQHILASNDPQIGKGPFCSDGYWNLDRPGPERMDFSQVDIALNDYTPKGSIILESRCWALDLATETIRTVARRPDVPDWDRTSADLTLYFHVEGSRAIPDHIESLSTTGHD